MYIKGQIQLNPPSSDISPFGRLGWYCSRQCLAVLVVCLLEDATKTTLRQAGNVMSSSWLPCKLTEAG